MPVVVTGPHIETPAQLVTSSLRRFGTADIDKHGAWILKRLQKAYPAHSDRFLIGWLRNITYDNGSLFLYHDNGVALFQVTSVFALERKPIVIERFVFAKEGFANECAMFYEEVGKWASAQSLEQVIVEQMSDVPHELIKGKLGRLFTRQMTFARL